MLMPLIEFSPEKQTELFDLLRQRQFSGQLVLVDSQQRQWNFYLSSGRIAYITGGIHPIRRWQRNLALATPHVPEIPAQPSIWQSVLEKTVPESLCIGWEYQLLCYWIDRQEITLEQANKAIWLNLVEILFDVNQIGKFSYELREDKLLSARLIAIESRDAIAEAQKTWQSWQATSVTQFSPHMTLAIEQPDQIDRHFSPQQSQSLLQLCNGKNALYDLARQLKRDVITIVRLFLPYIESGLMKLIDIPDLPSPVSLPIVSKTSNSTIRTQQPLIACVDDSPLICYFMETIVTKANCRFVAINDSLQAIKILSDCQPDLIFLDLVMPKIDGYEVCSQLRKIPDFRRTPIVILTGNDGFVDRVKAKLVGASGFINKPVNAEIVLGVIGKHFKAIANELNIVAENEVKYRGRPIKMN
jgi:chemotaxis family two-component system response regulator PixG